MFCAILRAQLPFILLFREGGTGDFKVSRHVSKQIATGQKLYTREGQKYMFSESPLSALPRKLKIESIGTPSGILVSPLGKICRNRVVFTKNVSPSTSFRGVVLNFVLVVLSGTQTELTVRFFISSLLEKYRQLTYNLPTVEVTIS